MTKYRHAVDRLARFAGDIDPAALTAGHLRGWVAQLRAEGLATSTQHDYLVWVKTWLTWLADEGGYGVQASATARARPTRVVQEPIVPFSEAEIRRLFAACTARTMRGQRSRAIVATLLDTGIRADEARGLQLCDTDLDEGQIGILPIADKTRKGRTIPLGRRARLELGRYWTRYRVGTGLDDAPSAPLFIAETGRALERRALQLLMLRLGARGRRQGPPASLPAHLRPPQPAGGDGSVRPDALPRTQGHGDDQALPEPGARRRVRGEARQLAARPGQALRPDGARPRRA